MSKFLEYVFLVGGWFFCMAILTGAYIAGRWITDWTDAGRDFGLLSALAFVWLYEHRNLDRLRDLMQD
jgi:hypothetical protein